MTGSGVEDASGRFAGTAEARARRRLFAGARLVLASSVLTMAFTLLSSGGLQAGSAFAQTAVPSPAPARSGAVRPFAERPAPSKSATTSGKGASVTGSPRTSPSPGPDLKTGSRGTALPVPADEGHAPDGPSAKGEPGSASTAPSKSDFAYGAFQRGFYLTARDIAEPLANLGDPAAQTLLGEIYSRGLGVPQNLKEAARWYKASAESGNPEGQFRYAMMLLDGKEVAPDADKAKAMMKAAAEKGLPLAEYNFAQMLIEASPTGGFVDAMPYFAKAADAGVPDAQYAMAQLYEYGKGVETDPAQARTWLHEAAVGGSAIAQVEYGIWLINGKGGPAQPQDGFGFLKFAAERGNPIAINRIAHLFKDGIGTTPDPLEAAKWALLAKRVENSDPVLDDFFRGLDADTKKSALEAANRFRSG